MGAIYYAKAGDFNQQTYQIDILSEPENSPIRKVIQRVAQETSWDNPMVQAELAVPQKVLLPGLNARYCNVMMASWHRILHRLSLRG